MRVSIKEQFIFNTNRHFSKLDEIDPSTFKSIVSSFFNSPISYLNFLMINIKQFRIFFTPLSGFFFIFLSQYLFAIGNKFVDLVLRSGHRRFTQNSPCFVLLRISIIFSSYFTIEIFASRV